MAKSINDFIGASPNLAPVAIEIESLSEEILVHQFVWEEFNKVVELEDDADVTSFEKQVLCLLWGSNCLKPDYKFEKQAFVELMRVFTVAQVREIYQKGFRVNGFGAGAVRDAEKK